MTEFLETYGKGDYHEPWCQAKRTNHDGHADAAKRIRDEYMLHRAVSDGFNVMGKFIACRLDDGSSDHVLYDSHYDAVRHHKNNENFYTYIKLVAPTMNACEAYVMLKTARAAYDHGLRLADPDHKKGGRTILRRVSIEDMLAISNGMPTNLRFAPPGINNKGRKHR